MSHDLHVSHTIMQRMGIRRLLVISGQAEWCRQQAHHLSRQLAGDWIWASDTPIAQSVESIQQGKIKTLLGQERKHGVFDATRGLDIEALAVLAGALCAGSWLLLLVPTWADWPWQVDNDSLRWSEQPTPIATPHFIQHLQQQLIADPEVVLWRQGEALTLPPLMQRPDWQPPDGRPTGEQQSILAQLVKAETGIWVVTAPRGRGKSTLAGMLIAHWPGTCWVTGPAKAAAQILRHQAGKPTPFWAPDRLLQHCQEQGLCRADWLLIDEAAAFPIPLLHALLAFFPRVLLITTVQGYEGTGGGFLLKFCASLPGWHRFTLSQPIRWAPNDPLERLLNQTLLLIDDTAEREKLPASIPIEIIPCTQPDWLANPPLLRRFYGLLRCAHYRTSPLDLRRLMDAPGMHFAAAIVGGSLSGALWMVEEGGIDEDLAHAIWTGRRRPRGSLVAQSLAAHTGRWLAPTLLSRRISRVAVSVLQRRKGIARTMILMQRDQAQHHGIDFLSVSFGYTEELWHFWQRCGFALVRIGSQKEAYSGCYAAMAMLPLSATAKNLCRAAQQQLARDWCWLQHRIPLRLPIVASADVTLNEDDWRELAGFAFAFRPLEASFAALQRLLIHSQLALPALRQHLEQQLTVADSLKRLSLTGRKALREQWRQEARCAMAALDQQASHRWQHWSAPRP